MAMEITMIPKAKPFFGKWPELFEWKSQKNSLKQPAFKAWKMLSGRQMYWIFSACIKIIRTKKYESFLKKGQNWVQTLPVGIEG
jgi:hypothetical protein